LLQCFVCWTPSRPDRKDVSASVLCLLDLCEHRLGGGADGLGGIATMNQPRARRREGDGGGVLVRAREGFTRKKKARRTDFWFCQEKYAKLLEMSSFFLPHIILGVGKHHDLANKKYQTVGDALMAPRKWIIPNCWVRCLGQAWFPVFKANVPEKQEEAQ
jgi:hypothetical protein